MAVKSTNCQAKKPLRTAANQGRLTVTASSKALGDQVFCKLFVLIPPLLLLVACTGANPSVEDNSASKSQQTEKPEVPVEETQAEPDNPLLEENSEMSVAEEEESPEPSSKPAPILETACENSPVRMGSEAEVLTEQSWKCSFEGEKIRVDLYQSAAQLKAANAAVEQFYRDSGDTRTLADLPLVCGDDWGVGLSSNENRDTLIVYLQGEGISAGPCS